MGGAEVFFGGCFGEFTPKIHNHKSWNLQHLAEERDSIIDGLSPETLFAPLRWQDDVMYFKFLLSGANSFYQGFRGGW